MADVAQLVRAPGCGSGGRGFETRRLPHNSLLVIQIQEADFFKKITASLENQSKHNNRI